MDRKIIVNFFKLNWRVLTGKVPPSLYFKKIRSSAVIKIINFRSDIRLIRKLRRKFFPIDKVIIRKDDCDDRMQLTERYRDIPIDRLVENIEKKENVNKSALRKQRKINSRWYVAEYKGKIIGQTCMDDMQLWKKTYDMQGYMIGGTYVLRWYRGLGIGEALARATIEDAKKNNVKALYQGIAAANKQNINLSLKLGYKRADESIENKIYSGAMRGRNVVLYMDL